MAFRVAIYDKAQDKEFYFDCPTRFYDVFGETGAQILNNDHPNYQANEMEGGKS